MTAEELPPLGAINGVLRDGSSIELGELVCHALEVSGVDSPVVVWDTYDYLTNAASGAHWVCRFDGRWHYLGDELWGFLTGDGGSVDVSVVGPPLELGVGDPVPETHYSRLAS